MIVHMVSDNLNRPVNVSSQIKHGNTVLGPAATLLLMTYISASYLLQIDSF